MYNFSKAEQAFLEAERVGRMAQIGGDGVPHSSALCYASTPSALYIETTGTTWKVRNLRRQPQVSFVVDEYFEDWSKLRGLRLLGRGEVLEKGKEYDRGKQLLFQKYPAQFKKLGWRDGVNVVLKIIPAKVVNWGL